MHFLSQKRQHKNSCIDYAERAYSAPEQVHRIEYFHQQAPGAPQPASNLAFAGSALVDPVEGSTHGHGLAPKNAGFDPRYIEFGIVKVAGVFSHFCWAFNQSQLPSLIMWPGKELF